MKPIRKIRIYFSISSIYLFFYGTVYAIYPMSDLAINEDKKTCAIFHYYDKITAESKLPKGWKAYYSNTTTFPNTPFGNCKTPKTSNCCKELGFKFIDQQNIELNKNDYFLKSDYLKSEKEYLNQFETRTTRGPLHCKLKKNTYSTGISINPTSRLCTDLFNVYIVSKDVSNRAGIELKDIDNFCLPSEWKDYTDSKRVTKYHTPLGVCTLKDFGGMQDCCIQWGFSIIDKPLGEKVESCESGL